MFFGGKLFYFNKNFQETFINTPGLGKHTRIQLLKRLELNNTLQNNLSPLLNYNLNYKREVLGFLNRVFSQINSVNNILYDLQRYNIIRLYLIKSYKGRCHAIGKPVRGQRTWSNAWTSYNINKILRKFIAETKLKSRKDRIVEKINYKMTKKKYGLKKNTIKKTVNKKSIWY